MTMAGHCCNVDVSTITTLLRQYNFAKVDHIIGDG